MTQELSESAVAASINSKWIGRHYVYFPRTGSTNDLLKEKAGLARPEDLPAGTVYLTDFQEKGRGRLGRRWEAPPGTALLCSLLFRPQWPGKQLSWLTMLAGLAVAGTIEGCAGLETSLKWPNDVLLKTSGEWHKVCGILLEGQLQNEGDPGYAILGIGLNVNIPTSQLPTTPVKATSLLAATGKFFSRKELLTRLLLALESLYEQADSGISPLRDWQERLITLGKYVEVHPFAGGQPLSGLAEGVDEWGHLLVRTADGTLHTISAGDVTLRQS